MLEQHLQRLEQSAKLVGMRLPESVVAIRDRILAEQQSYQGRCPLKIRVIVTLESVGVDVSSLPVDVSIEQGVSATLMDLERDPPQEAKQWPFTQCQRAHESARQKGFFEALLVDQQEIVREGAYSNLFWVKDSQVFTTRDRVLKGITRLVICNQMSVTFLEITANDLLRCDEVFITKTTTGVTPITSIDGQRIGNGMVGPITKQLLNYFRALERFAA